MPQLKSAPSHFPACTAFVGVEAEILEWRIAEGIRESPTMLDLLFCMNS